MISKITVDQIAHGTGLNSRFLYLLSNHISDYYRIHRIPKKNGKFRTIEAPAPVLKRIQRYILRWILPQNLPYSLSERGDTVDILKQNGIPFHYRDLPEILSAATAFEPGCSIRKNAEVHCGKPVVISLDVKNFFPSLRYGLVRSLFQQFVNDDGMAVMLANFCTLNGHLPQGAVTSPHISNLLMHDFDVSLRQYCLSHNLTFTRYADDLTFSGDPADEEITGLIRCCKQNLAGLGLRLNHEKIRIQRQGMRQEVTGIVVNAKTGVPREARRRLRQQMYYLNKHWEHEWRKLDEHTLNVMLGQANFIWDMDRDNPGFCEYRKQLLEIKHYYHR